MQSPCLLRKRVPLAGPNVRVLSQVNWQCIRFLFPFAAMSVAVNQTFGEESQLLLIA